MAVRAAMAERRAALLDHVREGIRSGVYSPGGSLPSLRDLGTQFALSRDTVQSTLHLLVVEGILTAESRSGMFVADRNDRDAESCFLMIGPAQLDSPNCASVRTGFERAVSRRGGVTLVTGDPGVVDSMPELSGVFWFWTFRHAPLDQLQLDLPRVAYSAWPGQEDGSAHPVIDRIRFDDFEGGRDAARHLLDRGHRRVAFLARHLRQSNIAWRWADHREDGWRKALADHDDQIEPICFHPIDSDRGLVGTPPDAHRMAELVAERAIAARDSVDAFVGVDDWSISAFLRVWRAQGLPEDAMPPMVGFEDLPEARSPFVTSVRPPWERLGEVAADLLWQRSVGQIAGPQLQRLVPMDIAARLSSRRDWRLPAANL